MINIRNTAFAACCQPRDTNPHNVFARETCNSFGANQSLCIANDPNCVFIPGMNCTVANLTRAKPLSSWVPLSMEASMTTEREPGRDQSRGRGGGRGGGPSGNAKKGQKGKGKKRRRRRRRRRRRKPSGRNLRTSRLGERITERSATRRKRLRRRRQRRRESGRSGRLQQGGQNDQGGSNGEDTAGGADDDSTGDTVIGRRTDLPPYPGFIPSFTSAPFPVLPAGTCVARPPENAVYANATAASLCATVKRRALCEGSLYSLCRWVPAIGASTQRFCYPYSPGTERAKAAKCPSRTTYSSCVAASPCKWYVVSGVPKQSPQASGGPAPSPKVVAGPGAESESSATLPGPAIGGPAPAPIVVR